MSDPNTINLIKLSLPINSAVFSGESYEFGIQGRSVYDYSWIYYMACVFSFFAAAASGTNDVANSFATSVGGRSLKMWQAILAASICEFAGAFLLGARTVDTVRSNIVPASTFLNHEDLLMFGMLLTLIFLSFFLVTASHFEINVSTTHTAIGSIIGFALCSPSGAAGVNWTEVGKIVGSWFASPVLSGIISAAVFLLTRKYILRHENAHQRALIFFPFLTFITMFLNAFFVMYNGGLTQGKGLSRVNIPADQTVGWAVLFATITALFVWLVINPLIRRRMEKFTDEQLEVVMGMRVVQGNGKDFNSAAENVANLEEGGDVGAKVEDSSVDTSSAKFEKPPMPWWEKKLDILFRQESIHDSMLDNERVQDIHSRAEKFSIRSEFALGYLQILTACCASFAHGAGDVANYIGPLAAIDSAFKNGAGKIEKKSGVEDWLLGLGGAGLVFGLATYGQKVIAAFGVKTVRITPARGYAVELSAAIVIITAAFLGIPISTSHSFVGAIVGVGLCEGRKESVNWHIILKNIAWWFATLLLCVSVVGAIFSFVTFAPSQIYPLSKVNCLAFYTTLYNTSNGDPGSFTINAQDGTLMGLYGYPSTGEVLSF